MLAYRECSNHKHANVFLDIDKKGLCNLCGSPSQIVASLEKSNPKAILETLRNCDDIVITKESIIEEALRRARNEVVEEIAVYVGEEVGSQQLVSEILGFRDGKNKL